MTTVAIICEYNPFHSGHKYHIDEIRREFGEDTTIIAIMSGNYTQRGQIAMADKSVRARMAIEGGVNLCLELPFPFSSSSAEIFARSAVSILNRLKIVDYLSFGSESGDIDRLIKTARITKSKRYQDTIKQFINCYDFRKIGYPKLCEMALAKISKNDPDTVELLPNNILAIEYIKALLNSKSNIKPHTIKRVGAGYGEERIEDFEHQSATALRRAIVAKDYSALEYIPKNSKLQLIRAIDFGGCPCDEEKIASAVIASLRLSPSDPDFTVPDAVTGLFNRLRYKSLLSNSMSELLTKSQTKIYTNARIRRAIWYYFFGVTSSDIQEDPAYTLVLGLDPSGAEALGKIKKQRVKITVITKPSTIDDLPEIVIRQKKKSDDADSIFQMTKPNPPAAGYALTVSPYVVHDDSLWR